MNPIHTGLWRDYLRKRKNLKENFKTVISLKKEKEKLFLLIKECEKEVKKWLTTPFKGASMARSHIQKYDDAKVNLLKAKNAFQRVEEKLEIATVDLKKSNEKYLKIRSSVIEAGLRKN